MKPVVVVVLRHVFRPFDHEMLVMAEPEAVQHDGVEPVHDIPEGIGHEEPAPEGCAAVDVAYQKTQQHAENDQGGDFLRVEDRPAGTVAVIDEAQLPATFDDRRGIVEDRLHRVPGHQEDQQGEKGAGREGFEKKGHKSMISSRNSEASATQSGQSRRGFPVPMPFSNLHWVAPFRSWNFTIICFIRERDRLRSLVARPTIIPAPTRAPQVPSIFPMPVP